MSTIPALTLAAALAISATPASSAYAADCTPFTEHQKMTLKGTIVQTAMPEDESGDKMYPSLAVVLDNPVCPATASEKADFIEIYSTALDSKVGAFLPAYKKWIGHHVIIIGKMEGAEYGAGADNSGNSLPYALDLESIKDADNAPPPVNNDSTASSVNSKLAAIAASDFDSKLTLTCAAFLGIAGTDAYYDISNTAIDHMRALPDSDKLGYGSDCHLGKLLDAECKLNRSATLSNAIGSLMDKAKAGKKLPKTGACGA